MLLEDKELQEIRAKAPPHAKRFEKVETPAGTVVLCNASKQQVNAHDSMIQVSQNMTMLTTNRARENLLLAMTVVPDLETMRGWCDDWPQLSTNDELLEIMQRLNGARAK